MDESFFDQKDKSVGQLKKMWYVLGISFAKYHQYLQHDRYPINKWQSSNPKLIEIVKSCLKSTHKITSTRYKNIQEERADFEIYLLSICNKKIYDDLAGYGLDVPKSERKFPQDIQEKYLDHFLRGFFDAKVFQVSLQPCRKRKYAILRIHFNAPFRKQLEQELTNYAGIIPRPPFGKECSGYLGSNVPKIYDFIYRDWDFVRGHNLYLASKKERLEIAIGRQSPKIRKQN